MPGLHNLVVLLNISNLLSISHLLKQFSVLILNFLLVYWTIYATNVNIKLENLLKCLTREMKTSVHKYTCEERVYVIGVFTR